MSDMLSPEEWLKRAAFLPKRYKGQEREVTLRMVGGFSPAWDSDCEALDHPIGEALNARVKDLSAMEVRLYATGEMAERVMNHTEGTLLRVKVKAPFGIKTDVEWTDEGPLREREGVAGLLLLDLLSAEPAVQKDSRT